MNAKVWSLCIALFLVDFGSTAASPQQSAELEIISIESAVLVGHHNVGRESLVISSNFEIGGLGSLSPLRLVVKDSSGKIHETSFKIDGVAVPGSISIPRDHWYGRSFSTSAIEHYFSVTAGNYSVKAIYDETRIRAVSDDRDKLILESPWVKIELKEDDE